MVSGHPGLFSGGFHDKLKLGNDISFSLFSMTGEKGTPAVMIIIASRIH